MWQPQQHEDRDAELHERLLHLMATSGYPIVQENGQRRYGPPPGWTGCAPGPECEVFVGRLPRSCYEDALVPLLSAAGRLYQLRLMMDFSGRNRGYAFAMYTNPEEAERAVRLLHGREVRPGRRVAVLPAADNSRLLVTSQPAPGTTSAPHLAPDLLAEELQRTTDGVVGVEARGSSLVVQYDSHRSAALARRRLAACVGLRVDWLPAGPAAANHRADASPTADTPAEAGNGGRRMPRAVTGACGRSPKAQHQQHQQQQQQQLPPHMTVLTPRRQAPPSLLQHATVGNSAVFTTGATEVTQMSFQPNMVAARPVRGQGSSLSAQAMEPWHHSGNGGSSSFSSDTSDRNSCSSLVAFTPLTSIPMPCFVVMLPQQSQ